MTCHLLDLFDVKCESVRSKSYCRNVLILLSAGGNAEELGSDFVDVSGLVCVVKVIITF